MTFDIFIVKVLKYFKWVFLGCTVNISCVENSQGPFAIHMSQGLLCTFFASKNVYLLMWKIGKHQEQLVKMISQAVFLFSLANMADSVIQFFQPLAVAT